jgi:hypothetical protein
MQKSVTYYLNGPLCYHVRAILYLQIIIFAVLNEGGRLNPEFVEPHLQRADVVTRRVDRDHAVFVVGVSVREIGRLNEKFLGVDYLIARLVNLRATESIHLRLGRIRCATNFTVHFELSFFKFFWFGLKKKKVLFLNNLPFGLLSCQCHNVFTRGPSKMIKAHICWLKIVIISISING